ncbi:MAG: DUF1840 family protein [Betaproteobacteria bacterium]|jgi:cyclopropane-fatty-acyl-phospholipid synthase
MVSSRDRTIEFIVMVYEFRSRATGSIVMTGKVAERMLGIVGKPAGPQGIITAAQLPAAIAALRGAVADERAARAQARAAEDHRDAMRDPGEAQDAARNEAITLEQRALPLIEMFERSCAAGRDVTWGV